MKRRTTHKQTLLTAVFLAAEEGGYTALVPALPGCISEGDSFEEARANIQEAAALYLEGSPVSSRRDLDTAGSIVASIAV